MGRVGGKNQEGKDRINMLFLCLMAGSKINQTATSVLRVTLLVLVLKVNTSLQQHCEPVVRSQFNQALVGKAYLSLTTKDYPTCMMQCHNDNRCMSVNFHLLTKTCDLNTQSKESLPERYEVRMNSIYSTNMAFRTPGPLKGSKENTAKSCLEILANGDSVGTGVYWLDPANTGTPIQAYCDMTTDGGGWTAVKRSVLQTASRPPDMEQINTYEVISLYNKQDKWIVPTVTAMMDIKNKIGFHQIHFYCRKANVSRVVSIMTKNNTDGKAVVDFFTGPSSASNSTFPRACDSFDRLADDTSFLSQDCTRWGTGFPSALSSTRLNNQWGCSGFHGPARMATIPFQMDKPPKYYFGYYAPSSSVRESSCDDDIDAPSPYSVNDTWIISVR